MQTLSLPYREFDSTIYITGQKTLFLNWFGIPGLAMTDLRLIHLFVRIFSSKGKQPVPVGYYLMIKPGGQSFLRGGLSTNMFKDATTMIRDYIAEHGDEFGEIIHFPEFQKYFEVQGTSLKNVPCYETV